MPPQRVDEHGADTVQAGGQLFGDLFEELHDVARCKTGQQRCKEAAGDAGGAACGKVGEIGAVHGQHTAGKATAKPGRSAMDMAMKPARMGSI